MGKEAVVARSPVAQGGSLSRARDGPPERDSTGGALREARQNHVFAVPRLPGWQDAPGQQYSNDVPPQTPPPKKAEGLVSKEAVVARSPVAQGGSLSRARDGPPERDSTGGALREARQNHVFAVPRLPGWQDAPGQQYSNDVPPQTPPPKKAEGLVSKEAVVARSPAAQGGSLLRPQDGPLVGWAERPCRETQHLPPDPHPDKAGRGEISKRLVVPPVMEQPFCGPFMARNRAYLGARVTISGATRPHNVCLTTPCDRARAHAGEG